jgi:sulfide:quinone oxidoreductase
MEKDNFQDPVVAVIGAGPAGISAAKVLASNPGVQTLLLAPKGAAWFLASTIDVALGRLDADRTRVPAQLAGVEVLDEEVEAIEPGKVVTTKRTIPVDAIIAAPGLALDLHGFGSNAALGFWDPVTAMNAREAISEAVSEGKDVAIVIESLPYRCPPAPYSLAMQIASAAREKGNQIKVTVTTPEPAPLSPLGPPAGQFILESCKEAGVEVQVGFLPDPEALRSGRVLNEHGENVKASLVLVVPRHLPVAFLKDFVAHDAPSPLVPVGPSMATGEPGIFVAGDASSHPYPRAAAPASTSGEEAASGALAYLGLGQPRRPLPEPECFLGHGAGRYTRMRLHFDGPPPEGKPSLELEGPREELQASFTKMFESWKEARHQS